MKLPIPRLSSSAAVIFIWLSLCIAVFIGIRSEKNESTLAMLPVADAVEVDSQSVVYGEDLARVWRDPREAPLLEPGDVTDETLWLARCIYSETKRPLEQELVAWVVRNRVETAYRGEDTYRQVVLDSYQFSAFNHGNRKRHFYLQLDRFSQKPGWRRALAIARMVIESEPAQRPFPVTTRHFFSEISMPGGRYPYWSSGEKMVTPDRNYAVSSYRFRFYADVR